LLLRPLSASSSSSSSSSSSCKRATKPNK
jgi:hypothetical protein